MSDVVRSPPRLERVTRLERVRPLFGEIFRLDRIIGDENSCLLGVDEDLLVDLQRQFMIKLQGQVDLNALPVFSLQMDTSHSSGRVRALDAGSKTACHRPIATNL